MPSAVDERHAIPQTPARMRLVTILKAPMALLLFVKEIIINRKE